MGQDHADRPRDADRPGESGHSSSVAAALAQDWVQAIATGSSVPMSRAEAQAYLRDLAEVLVAALSGASVDTQAASQVGAQLVAGGFTGTQSLSRTFEVLGVLATSYTRALRDHVLDQTAETSSCSSSGCGTRRCTTCRPAWPTGSTCSPIWRMR